MQGTQATQAPVDHHDALSMKTTPILQYFQMQGAGLACGF